MLQEEFPATHDWFKDFLVYIDLGFLGFDKDYDCKKTQLPYKKRKNQVLTEEQKNANRVLAKERVLVEHSIGGMKRYRILSDRLRTHDVGLYNTILGVCAGLWNFYLTN
jgi:hypothetical protein